MDNGTDLISYEHNIRVKHRLIHYYPVGPATMPMAATRAVWRRGCITSRCSDVRYSQAHAGMRN